MKAMILAAGMGERLRPLTAYVPKPLVPVLNVPVVVHTLAHLRAHAVREAVINLHHGGTKIHRALGDGGQLGMRIDYSEEQRLMGTAGGIKKAEPLLGGGTFVVINADVLTAAPLAKIVAHHRRHGALATLVLREDAQAEEYGSLAMGASGRIVRLLDLRVASEPHEAVAMFTGIHVLDRRIFDAIPPGRPSSITRDTYPALLRGGAPIYGYLDTSYWADIGQPAHYLAAHWSLLDGKLPAPGHGRPAGPMAQVGRGTAVSPRSRLVPPICVGEDCRIEEGAQVGARTTVGDHGFLGRDCLVEESILWDNVTVGAGASVGQAIVASNTTIPAGARVRRTILTPGRSTPLDTHEAP